MSNAEVAVNVLLLMFYWVPFALGAWLVEHWNDEGARRQRQQLVHPIRYMRQNRPTQAIAAH